MTEHHHHHLSRRERQILDAIYARGEATVNDIQPALPDPPTHTAVRTLLKILVDKGVISRKRHGREFIYRPTKQRSRAGQSAFRQVVQTFYDGSLEKAVGAHLASRRSQVSAEELDRLRAMIDEAKRKASG